MDGARMAAACFEKRASAFDSRQDGSVVRAFTGVRGDECVSRSRVERASGDRRTHASQPIRLDRDRP
jgi:hypothetical protein